MASGLSKFYFLNLGVIVINVLVTKIKALLEKSYFFVSIIEFSTAERIKAVNVRNSFCAISQ